LHCQGSVYLSIYYLWHTYRSMKCKHLCVCVCVCVCAHTCNNLAPKNVVNYDFCVKKALCYTCWRNAMSMLVPHLSGLARFKSLKYRIRRSLFFGRYTRPVLLDITMHTWNKQTNAPSLKLHSYFCYITDLARQTHKFNK
jgi:hypothetical protein